MSEPLQSLAATSMRAIYSATGAAVGAATLVRSMVATGEERHRLRERCGLWDGHRAASGQWIWIHGASVGEADIAVAIARALSARAATERIVITSTTATGRARVLHEKTFESRYFPIDFAPFVNRILAPKAPSLFVAVETEIWPETLRLLGERNVPVAFVNARLSDRSMPRYRRLRRWIGPLLARTAKVCARDAEAAARWRSLGVSEPAVEVTGNIKFDLAVPSRREAAPALLRSGQAGEKAPIFLAASTHDGEEELALEAFRLVAAKLPHARLLVAPRHPERAGRVIELVRAKGFSVSPVGGVPSQTEPAEWPYAVDVVVIDRLGLLQRAYACAAAAFVGGSLTAGPGGHNLLEPVAQGCPIACGPHLENVPDQREVLATSGAIRTVENIDELSTFWIEVIGRAEDFRSASRAARTAIEARRGALDRTVEALLPLLPSAAGRTERRSIG